MHPALPSNSQGSGADSVLFTEASVVVVDGDHWHQQVTLADPRGFLVGDGVLRFGVSCRQTFGCYGGIESGIGREQDRRRGRRPDSERRRRLLGIVGSQRMPIGQILNQGHVPSASRWEE
jgi:hypothetical protein